MRIPLLLSLLWCLRASGAGVPLPPAKPAESGKLFDRLPSEVTGLTEVNRIVPDHADAQRALGLLYAQLGSHAEALPLLEASTRSRPDDAEVLSRLGAAYVGLDRQGQAVPHLTAAVRLDPTDAVAYRHLGFTPPVRPQADLF